MKDKPTLQPTQSFTQIKVDITKRLTPNGYVSFVLEQRAAEKEAEKSKGK